MIYAGVTSFRAGRGLIDMIFAASQLQEKRQAQYDDLYISFIDLTQAILDNADTS